MKKSDETKVIVICIIAIVILLIAAKGLILLLLGIGRANSIRNAMRADEMSPHVQPGTVWQSKDGRIILTPIAEDGETASYVTVETESGAVELVMDLWLYGMVHIYLPTENSEGEEQLTLIAKGGGRCKDYDKYVVEIYSAEDIFEPKEKIVFYRISVPDPAETPDSSETESELGAARIRPIKPNKPQKTQVVVKTG